MRETRLDSEDVTDEEEDDDDYHNSVLPYCYDHF
jgi:hypothetical protein